MVPLQSSTCTFSQWPPWKVSPSHSHWVNRVAEKRLWSNVPALKLQLAKVQALIAMDWKSQPVKVQPVKVQPVQTACWNVVAEKLVPEKVVLANWARFRSRPA